MTHYIRFGDTYRLASANAINIKEKLPAATYAVKQDKDGLFLELISDFDIPDKLYGDCIKNADRIINTFWDRPNSTGVFLEGEKGSGKTLLAKQISKQLLAAGVPTLVVNSPLFGEDFNTFIQSINQPKVVFFDEFEKVYTNQNDDLGVNIQERVLTLFDGVYPSKTLFIVTCNDSWRIDKNMKNRPGRMYYMLSFKGLDEAFIREYGEENLRDKSQVNSIITVSMMFGIFNFDMLKALVEEMNRYNETAQDAIKLLNTKPSGDTSSFEMQLFIGGEEAKLKPGYNVFNGNPIGDNINVSHWADDMRKVTNYWFEPQDLNKVDGPAGTFLYVKSNGDRLILSRKKYDVVDWTKFVTD